MAEWVPIDRWEDCARLARPGIVFELRNADDQRLTVACGPVVPEKPWDWKTGPIEFRPVKEDKPERSSPLPKAVHR